MPSSRHRKRHDPQSESKQKLGGRLSQSVINDVRTQGSTTRRGLLGFALGKITYTRSANNSRNIVAKRKGRIVGTFVQAPDGHMRRVKL